MVSKVDLREALSKIEDRLSVLNANIKIRFSLLYAKIDNLVNVGRTPVGIWYGTENQAPLRNPFPYHQPVKIFHHQQLASHHRFPPPNHGSNHGQGPYTF